MKKIEAYIRPEKLDDIKSIADRYHLSGLSMMEIMGFGKQKGWKEYVRGREVDYNFVKKIKVEIVAFDEQIDAIVQSIVHEIHTGEYGDGKIFIYDVQDAIRVRTKEHGEAAIL